MRLVGAAVPRKRQREELPLSDQLLVGRLQLGLDASAKKSQISRKHLQIVREGERWFVRRLAANPAKLRRVDGGGDIDIGGAGKPTSETRAAAWWGRCARTAGGSSVRSRRTSASQMREFCPEKRATYGVTTCG